MDILISYGSGVSLRKQLEHVARRRLENNNYEIIGPEPPFPQRRFFADSMAPEGSILGVPSLPSHLPEAEPILPGHTLLRPALGMLKSAVKFPHRELEEGAGVYGNYDNLGIKYDGMNERVLYTGFRRMPSNNYILVLPQKSANDKKTKYFVGAPISVRPEHFYTDPQNDNEINENRLETQRAIKEFFQKARESQQNSPKHRKSNPKAQNKSRMAKVKKATKKNTLRLQEATDSEESDKDDHNIDDVQLPDLHNSGEDKKTWFANTKYAYTHLNINSEAPEHFEFLPLSEDDVEEIRTWWYYNQEDFEPFDDKELSKLAKPLKNENQE